MFLKKDVSHFAAIPSFLVLTFEGNASAETASYMRVIPLFFSVDVRSTNK